MASRLRLITRMPRAVLYYLVRRCRDTPVCLPDLRQDAIYYVSSHYKPHTLIDVATLTGYVIHVTKRFHRAYGLIVPWKSRWERFTAASFRWVFFEGLWIHSDLILCRLPILYGMSCTRRAKPNTTGSGVCPWMRNMDLRFIRPTLICAT